MARSDELLRQAQQLELEANRAFEEEKRLSDIRKQAHQAQEKIKLEKEAVDSKRRAAAYLDRRAIEGIENDRRMAQESASRLTAYLSSLPNLSSLRCLDCGLPVGYDYCPEYPIEYNGRYRVICKNGHIRMVKNAPALWRISQT